MIILKHNHIIIAEEALQWSKLPLAKCLLHICQRHFSNTRAGWRILLEKHSIKQITISTFKITQSWTIPQWKTLLHTVRNNKHSCSKEMLRTFWKGFFFFALRFSKRFSGQIWLNFSYLGNEIPLLSCPNTHPCVICTWISETDGVHFTQNLILVR